MHYHDLIRQRDHLIRQAWLANLAFAHQRLGEFGARIARARLQGTVTLVPADPQSERFWPVLTAREGNQSVLEEHFLEREIVELADILAFLNADEDATGFTFRIEDLAGRFLPDIRQALADAGVTTAREESPSPEDSNRGPS